ncbi:hypothetical protein CTI12_AA436180 [Artemisia annua]|uniref:Uncharacterized protein n=1 Tax=Artemisia annua TaxID=35608 RepID=A0A2U1LYX1_ARTAN|nr:hypothetical protein CTI12_AA436180 [Artemisia annua]
MLNVSDPFDTLLWLSASTPVSALTEPEMVIRRESKVVNVTSFMVRVDLQKHIDFSPTSPFGGGQPGRVKRKN